MAGVHPASAGVNSSETNLPKRDEFGLAVIAALPKKDGEYDLETLSSYVVSLKEDYPTRESASVLLEPTIPYDYLIQVMDVVRSMRIPGTEEDVTDKDKMEAKKRIMESMEQRIQQRFTSLCQAARTGDADVVGTLARQGANLNQTDYDGRTAFREKRARQPPLRRCASECACADNRQHLLC